MTRTRSLLYRGCIPGCCNGPANGLRSGSCTGEPLPILEALPFAHACGLQIRRHSVGRCQVADSALQRVVFGWFSGNSGHLCGRHMALGLATKSCCLRAEGVPVGASRGTAGHALLARQVMTQSRTPSSDGVWGADWAPKLSSRAAPRRPGPHLGCRRDLPVPSSHFKFTALQLGKDGFQAMQCVATAIELVTFLPSGAV
jgi:hypothetical protein